MITTPFLLAASSLLSFALGAPVLSRQGGGADYQVFGGDGSLIQGWPSSSQWLSFDELWALNLPTLKQSCTQYSGSPENNSDQENDQIKSALETVSGETGIDKIGRAHV